MSSVQPSLSRSLSLDSALPDMALHTRAVAAAQSGAGYALRDRSISNSQAAESRIWPLQPSRLPVPVAPGAPGVPVAVWPKPVTIAIDAEAVLQADGAAFHRPNAALPFVKKLLSLNAADVGGCARVEVVLLCHLAHPGPVNLLNALRRAELPIERVFFTRGLALHDVLKPCEAMLYLSCDPKRARDAVSLGIAAGFIMTEAPSDSTPALSSTVLQLSFDFDGVLADDLSQVRFDAEGLDAFHAYEDEAREMPMGPGPAQPLAMALSRIRDDLLALRDQGAELPIELRIAVVTSRGSVAMARVHHTLAAWGLEPDVVFCLAGRDKTPFISALGTDLFLDDDARHVDRAKNVALAVHMPTLASLT